MTGYIAGEIIAYVLIAYAIYWTTKKLAFRNKKEPNSKQRATIAVLSIFVLALLILFSSLR